MEIQAELREALFQGLSGRILKHLNHVDFHEASSLKMKSQFFISSRQDSLLSPVPSILPAHTGLSPCASSDTSTCPPQGLCLGCSCCLKHLLLQCLQDHSQTSSRKAALSAPYNITTPPLPCVSLPGPLCVSHVSAYLFLFIVGPSLSLLLP